MSAREEEPVEENSRYAERLPIGKKEILENFEHETLRRFYRDWYRPDLMAVIVAGDVDPDRVQALIEEHFGGIPAVEQPRERTRFTIPGSNCTLACNSPSWSRRTSFGPPPMRTDTVLFS